MKWFGRMRNKKKPNMQNKRAIVTTQIHPTIVYYKSCTLIGYSTVVYSWWTTFEKKVETWKQPTYKSGQNFWNIGVRTLFKYIWTSIVIVWWLWTCIICWGDFCKFWHLFWIYDCLKKCRRQWWKQQHKGGHNVENIAFVCFIQVYLNSSLSVDYKYI